MALPLKEPITTQWRDGSNIRREKIKYEGLSGRQDNIFRLSPLLQRDKAEEKKTGTHILCDTRKR